MFLIRRRGTGDIYDNEFLFLSICFYFSDWKNWVARNKACKDYHDEIDFQTDYVVELARDCGSDYPYDLDVADMFHTWEGHKDEDILTYRDKSFASKYTGTILSKRWH